MVGTTGCTVLGPLHDRHGIHAPVAGTPARAPGSVRRTVTTDLLRPSGPTGPLLVVGRGRDLLTRPDGTGDVLATAAFRAEIDFMASRTLRSFAVEPPRPALGALVGRRVASGFRAAAEAADPALLAEDNLLYLLVDDLPVATLVSGHAVVADAARHARPPAQSDRPALVRNLCAGFTDGGTIMDAVDTVGRPPVVTGPAAPPMTDGSDPSGWHEFDPLPPHAVRRARRMDLGTDMVDLFYRDSYVRPDGLETVIHEYTVTLELDPAAGVVLTCEATPRVLPWLECPAAAVSATRLAGLPLRGLRRHVRDTFTGTSTCTHLNDTLRALDDVPTLLRFVGA